jgi:hypothetical protein
MKIEVGEAGAFDAKPRPRADALQALEERAGPQARARAVTIEGEVRTERAAEIESSVTTERAADTESSAFKERPKRRKPMKSLE